MTTREQGCGRSAPRLTRSVWARVAVAYCLALCAGVSPATAEAQSASGGGAPATSPSTLAPLAPSNYSVRPVCGTPEPGRMSCMASELIPVTAAARARAHTRSA
jgi:hypothetical protein